MVVATSENRLLRLGEVLARVGFSKSTLYRMMAAGQFPSPVKVGGQTVRWRSEEIESWIDGLAK